jgi:nucleotide-binding universal stress UspA family protein
MTSGLAAAAAEEALEQVAAEVRGQIEELAREYQLKVTFLKRRGDPYAELRRAADEVQADMLVVGASTQAGHRLVGSVAGRLVKAGRWPVVVVP